MAETAKSLTKLIISGRNIGGSSMRRRYILTITGVCLLLAMVFSLSGIAGAASVTVRPESMEAAEDSIVDLPIKMVGAPGIGALQTEMVYDPAVLKPQTVKRGSLLANGLLEFNADKPGRVMIAMVTLDAMKGDGTVATVGFKVVGDKGQSSTLKLENSRAWEGSTHLDVVVSAETGQITVVGNSGFPWWIILIAVLVLLVLVMVWLLKARGRHKTA
jgi:hypothetical protein